LSMLSPSEEWRPDELTTSHSCRDSDPDRYAVPIAHIPYRAGGGSSGDAVAPAAPQPSKMVAASIIRRGRMKPLAGATTKTTNI
jgi:hypothetical protein